MEMKITRSGPIASNRGREQGSTWTVAPEGQEDGEDTTQFEAILTELLSVFRARIELRIPRMRLERNIWRKNMLAAQLHTSKS
jgi:Fic family protein